MIGVGDLGANEGFCVGAIVDGELEGIKVGEIDD